ncbi:MAG: vacuolar iron transporter family protein [Frankiaceae bacterium]|nr:vacuolar iron transporter family protein [Frankiaceae bacterium]
MPEFHQDGMAARMNWLRAGVLGANDGIVSIAGLVVGVAGATTSRGSILTVGAAGLVAGAVSMSLGEYVSVSSQRDSEHALLAKERRELAESPEAELAELVGIYRNKGLSPETAKLVAEELTAIDPFAAHVDAELGIDPNALTSAWNAAAASVVAFTLGGLLPLLAILLPPVSARVPVTFAAVLVALALTGTVSARIGGSQRLRAVLRNVLGGALALLVTFGVGMLIGQRVGIG